MRQIRFGMPLLSDQERRAVLRVLAGTTLTHGPVTKEFEEAFSAFTGAPYSIAVSSCTAALHLGCLHMGLSPGDEVLVSAETHVGTAHAVEACGATPVFIDSEKTTGNINISLIEEKITQRTRGIIVVHYLGMPVDMVRVCSIARKHGLFVIEDCALALGSRIGGIHAGLFGDIGCFSFYPVKHITTGEGGMVVTRDSAIAEKIARMRAFGVDRGVTERKVPGEYDVISFGLNYRMNESAAALGIEQMKRLPDFLKRRKENYEALTQVLKRVDGVELFQSSYGEFESSYYCHAVVLKNSFASRRDEVVGLLSKRGVGTSIYYPRPVPCMTYYRNRYGYHDEMFPVATRVSSTSIALPVGPHLTPDDMKYIAQSLAASLAEVH